MQKITSEAELADWLRDKQAYTPNYQSYNWCLNFSTDRFYWWVKREHNRIKHGIYKTTTVLDIVNKATPYFAHISTEDSKLIAYTPDATFGNQDRQLKSTIGRFLTKYFPFLSENKIREMVEEHEFEANPVVTWYQGDALTDAYLHRFGELGACMSKDVLKSALHPTMAYHTPHIKLACFEINNKITARTLVYENGNDKRYFRVYGNKSLGNWLQKEGYKLSDWAGISLKKVPYKNNPNQYLMPYLDENNSRGNNQRVVILEDEMFLLEKYKVYSSPVEKEAVHCITAQGWIAAKSVAKRDYTFTCFLSKKVVNLLTEFKESVFYWDDKSKSLKQALYEEAALHTKIGFTTLNKRVFGDVPTGVTYDDVFCAIDPADKEQYTKLESTIYGEGKFSSKTVTLNGFNYLKKDCVKVYSSVTEYTLVYKKDKQLKNYVKTSQSIYIKPGIKTITTVLGKVIVPEIHKCWQLVDSTYVTSKPKNRDFIYGFEYFSNGFVSHDTASTWGRAKVQQAILDGSVSTVESYVRAKYSTYTVNGDSIYRAREISKGVYTKFLERACKHLAKDDPIALFINRYLAEANAIEAPHYLTK